MFQTKEGIIDLIEKDEWMIDILRDVRSLQLPDCWVCAGFVRSKIWDSIHGYTRRTNLPDIDVVYFQSNDISEATDKTYEQQLITLSPSHPWSVKNQARMHLRNHVAPYQSTVDGISKFPETATALAVRLRDDDRLEIAAPHGVDDVLQLRVKPTPFFTKTDKRRQIYQERIKQKDWLRNWPKLVIEW